jgi:twitching motility protein PilJ
VVLPSLLFILVALMFAAHSLGRRHSNADAEYVGLMSGLKLRSQQISRDAPSAALGDVQGLARLKARGMEMQASLDRLRNGDTVGSLPPLPASVALQLEAVEHRWRDMREDIGIILSGVQVAAIMRKSGKSLDRLANDQADPGVRVEDPRARQGVEGLASLVANPSGAIGAFIGGAELLVELHEAANMIDAESVLFLQATQALQERYNRVSAAGNQYTTAVLVFGILALSCILMLGVQLIRDARAHTEEVRRREQERIERNRRDQESILKLLDEMSDLAEGDLTAYVPVTEDIIGVVADAFNSTIEALRHLVARIDNSAQAVAQAAQISPTRAAQVSAASDRQNAEIINARANMQDMADSIERVSANAAESSEVAKRSVTMANKAAREVRETIEGLDNIRLTIQDTAKRLKRLGESSREIGAMVDLIDDIADQTSVLALNAAIQASMAGNSGRGFAVVADEARRLAGRAGHTTKRIEQLVQAVQADTFAAIESMERSTTGVVSGALLAQGAGTSLGEVESVSQHLVTLIESILAASREQAERASAMAKTMSAIRAFATQTRAGANTTAKFAGKLANLAETLKASVAGFRLPDSFDPKVVELHSAMTVNEEPRVIKREESEERTSNICTFRPSPR